MERTCARCDPRPQCRIETVDRVPAAMDLLEYQGKQLFARHGVPVPDGRPAQHRRGGGRRRRRDRLPVRGQGAGADRRPRQARRDQARQGRGEAAEHAEAILGMDIRGLTVHEVWIEGASEIASEYYASVVFDRGAKAPLVMLSTKGGMDIEAGRRRGPRRDRAPARRPAARLPGLPRPPAGVRGRRRRRRRAPDRRDARQALRARSSPRRRRSSRSTR